MAKYVSRTTEQTGAWWQGVYVELQHRGCGSSLWDATLVFGGLPSGGARSTRTALLGVVDISVWEQRAREVSEAHGDEGGGLGSMPRTLACISA